MPFINRPRVAATRPRPGPEERVTPMSRKRIAHCIVCKVKILTKQPGPRRCLECYYARGRDVAKRFWSKVDIAGPDDCWPWKAHGLRGYGQFSISHSKMVQAHRFAWESRHGEIPSGLYCCHHCDNPPCCNPRHLFLGTAKDNKLDCIAKRRDSRGMKHHWHFQHPAVLKGERVGTAKLQADSVVKIRNSKAPGVQLAKQYGVSPALICMIRKGQIWKHL